jgi:hypothetical protein
MIFSGRPAEVFMGNLLQQLRNNQAVLLMYLANELDPDDRIEVEQLLSNDAGLRAELAQLRKDYEAVYEDLRLLDVESPMPVSSGVAMRQVARMMKQWQVDQLVIEPPAAGRKWPRLPWWAYGTASAAAAIVAVVVWWGLKSDVSSPNSGTNNTVLAEDGSPMDPAQQEQADALALTMPGADDSRLANAENQATDLQNVRNDATRSANLAAFGTTDQTQ